MTHTHFVSKVNPANVVTILDNSHGRILIRRISDGKVASVPAASFALVYTPKLPPRPTTATTAGPLTATRQKVC